MPSKSYKGETGRRDVRVFNPNSLVLVEDEKHALYDPRIKMPLDESLVESIRALGVIEPVVVVPDGERMLVVAGRQRVRAARIAKVDVPCVVRKGDDQALAETMISENEIRRNDPPSLRAKRMQHLHNHGCSTERIARAFGCSAKAVRDTLQLLDCDARVRDAVDAGKLSVKNAARLAAKPRDEQRAVLAEMVAIGATKGKAAREALDGKGIKPSQRMRSRREIENALSAAKEDGRIAEAALLGWVLGGDRS